MWFFAVWVYLEVFSRVYYGVVFNSSEEWSWSSFLWQSERWKLDDGYRATNNKSPVIKHSNFFAISDYISGRLIRNASTKQLGEWFDTQFQLIGQLPRYLIPAYFDAVVTAAYTLCLEQSWLLMSPWVSILERLLSVVFGTNNLSAV